MKKFLLTCMMSFGLGLMAQTTVTIGAGATASDAYDNGNPIYRSSGTSTYHYSKSVQLLTAADLSGATVPSGSTINSIAYYKASAFNVSGSNAWTLNVYLKNSSATALASGTSWDTMTAGATLFYTATINSSNNFPAAAGWVTLTNNTSNTFNYAGNAIEVYIDWVPSGTLTSPYTGGEFTWQYDSSSTAQAMGTSNSSAIPGSTTSFSTLSRRYQTQLKFTSTPCTGTPNPGNTLSSGSAACAGPYNTTLSLQNSVAGSGITYQWYLNGSPVSGATSPTLNATITAASTYYCAVTCTGSGMTANSTPVNLVAPSNGISSFPWNENFDSMSSVGTNILPSCWLSVGGGSSNTEQYTTATSAGNSYNDPRSAPNYVTIYYPYSNAATLWTPKFYLTAGQSYDFSFYYVGDGLSGWQGDVLVNNNQNATGATGLNTFVTSTQTTTGGSNSTNYTKVKVTYVPTTTGNYTFGVKTLAVTSAPYYMGFDDFNVMITPSCTEPNAISVSNITSAGALVSWTAPSNAPAGGYDLYYSTSNTAPTATTTPNFTGLTGISKQLSNLTAASTYYVWVRSRCSTTTQSIWSGPATFSTLCTTASLPYVQNFESVTTPALPNCTQVQNAGNGNVWTTADAPTDSPGFTTKVLKYAYNSSSAANTWFYTQGLNLTGGVQYTITYKYGNNSTTYVEKLKVAYGTSPLASAMTNTIADYPSINDKTAHSVSVNFTPATSGIYYFGFNAYSDADQYYLYVDDISINTASALAVSEISGTKNTIKVYPNPFSEVLNISDASNVKNVLITDVAGRLVKTISNPSSELHLGELKQGMYLVTLEMKDGSKQTIKTIKK
ncbi:T9SS type A sorting domain-containing protein [uncultured Chryseobacterium sp.]|uniref:T9SS type A sorting domain-containing protein n=1 Tax=uncultured Chryseobacterium sp. TaxID=259322 RepID=UPI0025D37BB0|nr:T9SS type A sorting domain-containing protein [uncultured Chryseobacterium sp.]